MAFFDVCSVMLADVDSNALTRQREILGAAIKELVRNPTFVHAITYSTNSRKQVKTRFEMMHGAIAEVAP